jgi:hypothetical protein
MIVKSVSILGMLLTLTLTAVKAEAKGWRGIVPLKSTRADVERLLGLPGKHGRYQFENERAYIDYAGTGPCAPENACLCTVSEDTVLSIYVELEVEMSFSALKLNKKKYKKFVSPQDRTVATYSRDKDGIIYTVNEEHDEIIAIEYYPTTKDCEQALKRQNRNAKRPAKTSSKHLRRLSPTKHATRYRNPSLALHPSLDAPHSAC